MAEAGTGGFRDPRKLTRWTNWLLYAQVIITVVAVFSNAMEYQFFGEIRQGVFESEQAAMAAARLNDQRQQAIGLLQVAVYVVAGILILVWIHRANYNARQLGAREMEFTPGWSVGWYFIPIFNLVKPYQAMKEIWMASANPAAWQSEPVPSLLPWWWFFWLVSNAFSNIALRVAMRAEDIDDFVLANLLTQGGDVTAIPLSMIVLSMISAIERMQLARAAAPAAKAAPDSPHAAD